MSWQLTLDVEEFRRAADPYLAGDPVRNTVLLTLSESLRRELASPGARFGWWRENDGAPVSGAFVQTPPRPPLLGPMSEAAARELGRQLRGEDPGLAGVRGDAAGVAAFAEGWTDKPGARYARRASRLYRLGEPAPQRPAPAGRARVAAAQDLPLAERWANAYSTDIGEPAGPQFMTALAQRVQEGRLLLWEVEGAPVSMAGLSSVLAGQARIGLVYTPPALRGNGYAGAITAAAGRQALDAGAEQVLLFADLANPTANALYQRLGYRPVADHHDLDLSRPAEAPGP